MLKIKTKHTSTQREKKRILSEYSTTEITQKCAADQTKFNVQSKIHTNQSKSYCPLFRSLILYTKSDLSYNIQNKC